MAGFTERVQVLIDIVTGNAASSLNDLKTKVGEAEGGFGKLKASGSGAFDLLKGNGVFAVGALGTAVTTFAAKAVGDFENLALSAKNFSTAAGTSVQDASRWLETAKDLGVSSDDVSKAMSRLNREAAAGKLSEFGITAGNANDRLIQTLTYLSKIPDEGERARVSFELLGKNGAALAPLVANVNSLSDRLASVQGGKLISEEDAKNARALADNIDQLRDHFESLVLDVGKGLTPALIAVSNIMDQIDAGFSKLTGGEGGLASVITGFAANVPALGLVSDALSAIGLTSDSTGTSARQMGADVDWASQRLREQAQAASDAETALAAYDNAVLAEFNSELKFAEAVGNTSTKVDDYNAKLAVSTAAKGADSAANQAAVTAMNAAAQAALAQAAAAVQQASDQAAANGTTLAAGGANDILRSSLQSVANTLAPGSPLRVQLEGYIAKLNAIPDSVTTHVNVDLTSAEGKLAAWANQPRSITYTVNTVTSRVDPAIPHGAGGFAPAGSLSLVGERGPELRVEGSSATYIDAGRTGALLGGGGVTNNNYYDITVNAGFGTNGHDVGAKAVAAIQAYERANGTAWRS